MDTYANLKYAEAIQFVVHCSKVSKVFSKTSKSFFVLQGLRAVLQGYFYKCTT
jgi:hypothetical protein